MSLIKKLDNKNHVLLAMSGGTDSSVAAILLKKENYSIKGMTFRSYNEISTACVEKETDCCSVDSIFEAKKLAENLGFEHTIIDIKSKFEKTVIKDFINEYLRGRTPNPCIVCNRVIKWGHMIEEAKKLNCEYLATGHYAQIIYKNGRYFLRKGVDKTKDQSYFLWSLNQDNLSRTLFPLGHLTKTQVREIAKNNNYDNLAKRKESQEICFIPNDDYRSFLRERIPNIDTKIGTGNFVNSEGKIIGQHKGYPFYTIGQRKGLNIAMGYPAYVLNINADTNTITIGKRDELLKSKFEIKDFNLMKYESIPKNIKTTCKIRYNNHGEECSLVQNGDKIIITFNKPVSAITLGQSAVVYEDDDVVLGGIISKIL